MPDASGRRAPQGRESASGTTLDAYQAGRIPFAELDAAVCGWINHVRYADTWGLREHLFATHPIVPARGGESFPNALNLARHRHNCISGRQIGCTSGRYPAECLSP